jgi:hypothetical protein
MQNMTYMTYMTNLHPPPFNMNPPPFQYDRYAKKYDESEPPPKLYVKILKISKISKICNLKTGLPPGGRPVLRSQPYAIYVLSAKHAQYEQVVLHLVCAGPVCAPMLRWTCSGVAQQ